MLRRAAKGVTHATYAGLFSHNYAGPAVVQVRVET